MIKLEVLKITHPFTTLSEFPHKLALIQTHASVVNVEWYLPELWPGSVSFHISMYVSKVVWPVGLCWTLEKEATGSLKHWCLPARLFGIVFKELWFGEFVVQGY